MNLKILSLPSILLIASGVAYSQPRCVIGYNPFSNRFDCVGGAKPNAFTRSKEFSVQSPTTGLSGAVLVINPPTAIHITRLWCNLTSGTNVVLNLDKRTEGGITTDSTNHLLAADLTITTAGANTASTGGFLNSGSQCGGVDTCAVAAHAPVILTVTSVSGTPAGMMCSIDFTIDDV